MKGHSLRSHLLVSFFLLILFIVAIIGVFAYYFVEHDVVSRAQRRITAAINSAQTIYSDHLSNISTALNVIADDADIPTLMTVLDIDYLYEIPAGEIDTIISEIAREAAITGSPVGGTRIIEPAELETITEGLSERLSIDIIDTPKARPCEMRELKSVLAIEYALPVYDKNGELRTIRYGGSIINKDFTLVDRIHGLVFEEYTYKDKPVGTVTIFQDDVRVSTNVLNDMGIRAVGTRVSQEVYDKTVKKA